MNSDIVLKCLAACGLDCSRCAEYKEGEIKHHAAKLLELLGNYSRMVPIKATQHQEFNHYQEFAQILQSFSTAGCAGCRSNECLCPVNCEVKTCRKEIGVDYCFQCSKFPCNQTFPTDSLRERWLKNNNRMKDIGPVEFYKEQLKLPRY